MYTVYNMKYPNMCIHIYIYIYRWITARLLAKFSHPQDHNGGRPISTNISWSISYIHSTYEHQWVYICLWWTIQSLVSTYWFICIHIPVYLLVSFPRISPDILYMFIGFTMLVNIKLPAPISWFTPQCICYYTPFCEVLQMQVFVD